ncbi:MAG: Dabb family protein [Eubacteriales bacterium]|nr:Dabb family protein [Eubacteriales bacterium]
MVTHIVLWNYLDTLTAEQKAEAGKKIKKDLECLKSVIPGVISLEVKLNEMASSTKDIGLFSEFESEEALNQYAVHPEHLKVVQYIKTVTCGRTAFDY